MWERVFQLESGEGMTLPRGVLMAKASGRDAQ